jgi:nicotinamide riboside kinase
MHAGKYSNNKIGLKKIRIVLTGPESTAKTSLSKALSNHYKVNLIPEFSRYFLENSVAPYTFEEVSHMAKNQVNLAEITSFNLPFQLEDTDLLTYLVWQKYKYNLIDPELLNIWEVNKADFYLMCLPDVKWQNDPLREHPQQRIPISKLYINYLIDSHLSFGFVSGTGVRRLNNAVFLIEQFLKKTTFAF